MWDKFGNITTKVKEKTFIFCCADMQKARKRKEGFFLVPFFFKVTKFSPTCAKSKEGLGEKLSNPTSYTKRGKEGRKGGDGRGRTVTPWLLPLLPPLATGGGKEENDEKEEGDGPGARGEREGRRGTDSHEVQKSPRFQTTTLLPYLLPKYVISCVSKLDLTLTHICI